MNCTTGSIWRKCDLHLHTPKSFDYKNRGLTADDIVTSLVNAGVEIAAITDHHVLDAAFIRAMQAAGKGRLTVMPGIELASNLGGDEGVHFIGIFDQNSDLDHLSTELMVKLDIASKRKERIPEEKLYVDFQQAVEVIQQLRGLVTIHGHGKASSYETISSRLKFKQQQKTDLLRKFVDVIEVGSSDHQQQYKEKIFPAIGFSVPIITCSDNHNAADYGVSTPCWIKADSTFAGLRMALREPEHRFCLEQKPKQLDRIERNKTRYIKSVSFSTADTMPRGEIWFGKQQIPLNPGLVAIIGNKGSGKSALADCLGLLGSCTTCSSFSFLESGRFRHAKNGRAQHSFATLNWYDGPDITRRLDEEVGIDEPERVKYLPQNFVENVCNQLELPGSGGFEIELKKVIFSKVPPEDRLGKNSLDELVEYRTQEIRRAADALLAGMKDLASKRAMLEEQLDPQARSTIQKRIQQRDEEIKSHDAGKPLPKENPSQKTTDLPETQAKLAKLTALKEELQQLEVTIKSTQTTTASEQLKAASARKLLDKMQILATEVHRQTNEMTNEAQQLGLDIANMISFSMDTIPVQTMRDQALAQRDSAQKSLNDTDPPGLLAQKSKLQVAVREAQSSLDRPQQEYQQYLTELAKWDATRKQLIGAKEDPNSLSGMQQELANLDKVPGQILAVHQALIEVASKIHALRLEEAAVFSELYKPIQDFIANHHLAKDQLKLEFKVDLVQDSFVDQFLKHINQGRQGSFYGYDEGRQLATSLVASAEWSDWNSVQQFIVTIIEHLHNNKRADDDKSMLLKSQIGKGKTAADLFSLLYGLEYLQPRYLLRWESKDVKQLSPGERGTLLLIFYLLVDDSDVPLIIDQPEANLDNLTVAQKLVHCIRDARDRRQVILVTHNPNLAVVCDADQLIHASMDKTNGNKITYTCGGLEHPELNQYAIDVLEGSRGPFNMRDRTYEVMGR